MMLAHRRMSFAALALVIICAGSASGVARGGDEPGTEPAPLPTEFATGPRYRYDPEGRDIFCYREVTREKPIETEWDIPGLGDTPAPGDGDDPGDDPVGKTEDRQAEQDRIRQYAIRKALEKYDEAVQQFLSGQFDEAGKKCEKALTGLENAKASAQDVTEKLARLQRASEELHNRSEIEKEFGEIDIQIQSIVHKDRSPAAVVNGRVVRQGDYIADGRAQIFRIERGYIVFMFKQYKVRKQMR